MSKNAIKDGMLPKGWRKIKLADAGHSNVQKMHIANSDKPVNFYPPYPAPPESVVAIFATTAVGW